MEFTKPTIEYADLWPLLVIFGAACAGVLVEAFVPRERRYLTQTVLAALALLVALAGTVLVAGRLDVLGDGAARGAIDVEGTVVVDGPALFFWGIFLALPLAAVLLLPGRGSGGGLWPFAG